MGSHNYTVWGVPRSAVSETETRESDGAVPAPGREKTMSQVQGHRAEESTPTQPFHSADAMRHSLSDKASAPLATSNIYSLNHLHQPWSQRAHPTVPPAGQSSQQRFLQCKPYWCSKVKTKFLDNFLTQIQVLSGKLKTTIKRNAERRTSFPYLF